MSTMTRFLSDLRKKLTGATTELHSEITRLRSEIATKQKDLHQAQRAPLPVEEIIADRIPGVVAEHGAHWLERYKHALIYGDHALGAPDPRGSRRLPWLPSEPVPWGLICAAMPTLAQDLLAAAIQAVPYEPGPPSSERPELIGRLERELAALDATEEALIDEVATSGVVIAHRPEVLQRREREARQRQRHEEATANRAAREAALNARHEEDRARGRGAPSSYLAGASGERPASGSGMSDEDR